MKRTAAFIYVAVMLGAITLIDNGMGAGGSLVWATGSLCVGWVTRWPWLALLPFLAIPIAAPFGYPDEWVGRTPLPLWFALLWNVPIQSAILLAGLWGRRLYEQFRAART